MVPCFGRSLVGGNPNGPTGPPILRLTNPKSGNAFQAKQQQQQQQKQKGVILWSIKWAFLPQKKTVDFYRFSSQCNIRGCLVCVVSIYIT